MANTTSPLSEVGVAAMAGDILDEFNITSLDSNDPFSRFVARQFGYVRDEFLQLYPWHVATKRKLLEPTVAPEFGWTTAYNLPSDCIRLHPLRVDGDFNQRDVPYELENSQILCNCVGSLQIKYTFRQTLMSKWRPLMARAFAARLAMYGAMRITGKESYFSKARSEYQLALQEATHADALERGSTEPYTFGEDAFSVRGLEHW